MFSAFVLLYFKLLQHRPCVKLLTRSVLLLVDYSISLLASVFGPLAIFVFADRLPMRSLYIQMFTVVPKSDRTLPVRVAERSKAL